MSQVFVEMWVSDRFRLMRTAVGAVVFLLLVILLANRTSSNLANPYDPDRTGWAYAAYRDATYFPVVSMLEGNNPYDAEDYLNRYPVSDVFPPYLPSTLLVHLPFGLVPYKVSVALYFVLNLVLTILVAWYVLKMVGASTALDRVLWLSVFLLFTRPGQSNLVLGECTFIVALACYVCLDAVDRRPWVSAVALALATLKPTFGVPLAVLLFFTKRPRGVFLAAAISVVLCLAIVGVLVRNEGGVEPFVGSLLTAYDASEDHPESHPSTSPSRIDLKGLVGRLVGLDPGVAVEVVLAGLILGWGIWLLRRSARQGRPLLGDAGPICLAILTSIFHQPYDLVLLILPAVMLLSEKKKFPWLNNPGAWWLLFGLYILVFFNYLGSATAYNRLGIEVRDPAWVFLSSLNGFALLGAMGIYTWVALQRLPAGEAKA